MFALELQSWLLLARQMPQWLGSLSAAAVCGQTMKLRRANETLRRIAENNVAADE